MHFPDILQLYPRVHQQVLTYLEIDLPHHPQVTLLQQIVVWQDTARNGIFDGHHSAFALPLAGCHPHQFPERSACDHLHILAEILLGRYLVETALIALNRNSCAVSGALITALCLFWWFAHIGWFVARRPGGPKMQKSRLLTGTLYVNFFVYLLVNKSNPGLLVK